MRRSAEEKAETRRQIVRTAGHMIRGRGLERTGVADVMAEAGLTHGGFYRHFSSKDELAATALADAMAHTRGKLRTIAETTPEKERLAAVIDAYLNEPHRDRPDRGCVMASVGMEAQRAGGLVQTAYEDGFTQLLALFTDVIPASTRRQAEDRAHAVLSVLVGGLLLARALKHDATASRRALKNAREAALAIAAI